MILQILVSVSFATTWLIKAPQANPHDFHVYAQNTADSKISQAFLTCNETQNIQRLIKEAQYSFLNGSLSIAEKKFAEISDLKWTCDWKEDERKIIVFALIRQAQLTPTPAQKMNYLMEALAFDEDIKPDSSVFPPPLIELYKNTRTQMTRRSIFLPPFAKKYSAILKNGKFISLNNLAFEAYSWRARITLISDTYRPETLILSPDELQSYNLEPHPLVSGTCQSYTTSEDLKGLEAYKIFFDNNCIKEGSSVASLSDINTQGFAPATATLAVSERKKSWIERNIIWVGISLIGSVIIANQISKHNDQQQTVVMPSNSMAQ